MSTFPTFWQADLHVDGLKALSKSFLLTMSRFPTFWQADLHVDGLKALSKSFLLTMSRFPTFWQADLHLDGLKALSESFLSEVWRWSQAGSGGLDHLLQAIPSADLHQLAGPSGYSGSLGDPPFMRGMFGAGRDGSLGVGKLESMELPDAAAAVAMLHDMPPEVGVLDRGWVGGGGEGSGDRGA